MSDYDDLVTVLAPYGAFDIASRYPAGIPAFHIEPFHFSIDGALTVSEGLLNSSSPRDTRQFLLQRYESLLSKLRSERWVLDSAPRLTFDSYLEPALWTVTNEVARHEHEQCISAVVDISIVRCAKRREPHGHNYAEGE